VDRSKLYEHVAAQAQQVIAKAASGSLDVVGEYARPIAARTARLMFGISRHDDRLFMDVARAIFDHTFQNITGDKAIEARALRAAVLMREWFQDEIARRRSSGDLGSDMMGALLKDGLLDDEGVRRTLGGMLVGAIDTTATAVAKIVKVLGQDRYLREHVSADRHDMVKLTNWCFETLRRWPHNPLLLRTAAAATTLGAKPVKAGATVVAWTQAAMLDPDMFPEPQLLKPDRPRGAYLHFGGGLHPCAGRVINEFQIPILVGQLLERGIDSVGRIAWAGSFPDRLVVKFSGRRA
jgi:cytochrome P450